MEITKNTLVQITNNGMGAGDDVLGQKLLLNYLKLVSEENRLPKFIALYNAGVKILKQDSNFIDALKVLEQKGVKLIACKTCLNHFEQGENLPVGIAGTMIDIIELQTMAEKVVNL